MASIDASVHSLRNSRFKQLYFEPLRARNGVGFVTRELGLFLLVKLKKETRNGTAGIPRSVLPTPHRYIIKAPHDTQFPPAETQKTVQRPPQTSTYIRMGSPTPSISGITHFRSNAFARTILKIFCTFIEADVEQKISDACMARAKRFACERRMS